MSQDMTPKTKQDALLGKVQQYAKDERAAIASEARDKADKIINDEYGRARVLVRSEIARIRRESATEMEKQSARIHTARRHDLYDQENKFLNTVWPQLDQALLDRWADIETRQEWLAMVIEAATERLHGGAWTIEHPKDWSVDELKPFMDQIQTVANADVSFVVNPELRAGLRILANGAVLDGTLKGLMLDRRTISAVFLAEMFALTENQT